MKKRMEPITVEATADGQICISGDDNGNGVDSVFISADQVETLCKWLEEARAEIASTHEVEA